MLSGFNELLAQGGYPRPNTDWFLLHYARESEAIRAPEWSSWINFGISDKRRGKEESKAADVFLYQMAMGLGRKIIERKKYSLAVHVGFDLTSIGAQLFDGMIDTTNLNGYIAKQSSDQKSLSFSQVCIRTGLRLRVDNGDCNAWVAQAGYNIPAEPVSVGHFRGSFGDLSDTRIGGFYAGLGFGFIRSRCDRD